MMIYKTRSIMASEYGRCRKTFRKMIAALEHALPKGNICPRWQKYIYEVYHYPTGVDKMDYDDVRLPEFAGKNDMIAA